MKKILSCLFSLMLCLFVFAGCNLIELNKTRYYSQVAVKIIYSDNKTKEFTMEDFYWTYVNYGYQYAEQNAESGVTAKDALENNAKLMVERFVLIEDIKTKITLTDSEKNALKKQVYDSLNAQLKELESEVRVEWNRVVSEPEASKEEDKTLRAAYNEYSPTIELAKNAEGEFAKDENGSFYLGRVVEKDEQVVADPGQFKQNITDQEISDEAMKRFKKKLQTVNENLGKKVKDQDLLSNEIARMYSILEENKYISKYQTMLLNNAQIKSDSVVNAYIDKYKRDYEKYSNNESAYHTAMASDASAVYYHPNSGNEYMWVTHILFKFSEAQTAEINKLKADLKSNTIEESYYNAKMAEVTSMDNTIVKYVNEAGETVSTNVTNAFADINQGVNRYSADSNFLDRAAAFNNYIYKYNDDEGIMNKDFAYVVNLDTSVEDKMVKEFANESRALYQKDLQRGVGKGSMSLPVKTEFGYHVILNLGAVKNIVEYQSINNLTWNALYNVKTQPSSNKTIFNYEYDTLKLDENFVSTYLSGVISDLTASVKRIDYYSDRYLKIFDAK